MFLQASEVTNNPQGQTTATAYVTIRIVDDNDETPTFSQNFYNASVQENMPLRIPVTFLPLGTEMVVHDYDEVVFTNRRTYLPPANEVAGR